MRQISVREEESGQRLDKFLRRYLPAAPVNLLYKMLRRKNITVNQKKTDGSYILQNGDRIEIYFSEETFSAFQQTGSAALQSTEGSAVSGRVVYESEQVLLLNKPAGWLSQKSGVSDVSAAEKVTAYLLDTGKKTPEDLLLYRPGPANRLDRNTSGMMVFPLSLAAAREISELFRNRTVDKKYLALVRGEWKEEKHLRAWIERDGAGNRSAVFEEKRDGREPVELHIRPLQIVNRFSLLLVTLLTGKTHQIRAQLQNAGYPLVGDPKYGTIEHADRALLKRQFLHAWKLTFPEMKGLLQDVSGRTFTAPLPQDLAELLDTLNMDIPR